MAIAVLHPSFRGLRGAIGGIVFKQYTNKTVLTRFPRMPKTRTAAQQAHAERFRRASEFARRVQRDPVLYARYALLARARGCTVRGAVIGEYLRRKVGERETGNVAEIVRPKLTLLGYSRRLQRDDRLLARRGKQVFADFFRLVACRGHEPFCR